jgi:hypothetical protein
VLVVCCQVEVPVTGPSLIHRSPTMRTCMHLCVYVCVTECDHVQQYLSTPTVSRKKEVQTRNNEEYFLPAMFHFFTSHSRPDVFIHILSETVCSYFVMYKGCWAGGLCSYNNWAYWKRQLRVMRSNDDPI